jgi:hypothetical protein
VTTTTTTESTTTSEGHWSYCTFQVSMYLHTCVVLKIDFFSSFVIYQCRDRVVAWQITRYTIFLHYA